MLTLQFIPYSEIDALDSDARIKKLLSIVKEDKIVVMEGKLKSEEEAELIRSTMEQISDKFKGVELAVIYPDLKTSDVIKKLKYKFINMILGDRQGLTIIGPAKIVKEIKQDPDKIQLLTEDGSSSRKRKQGR